MLLTPEQFPWLLRQRWPNQAFVVCTDFSHLYILLSFHHYDVWECDVAYVTVQKTRREKWWIEVGKNVNSLSCYTYVMCMYVHSENYRFHNLHFNRNWFYYNDKICALCYFQFGINFTLKYGYLAIDILYILHLY